MAVRYFALIAGLAYVLVGILGFFPGAVQDPAATDPSLAIDSGYGRLLGIFPVNVLHNLVHLALGVWGVIAYREWVAARGYARGLAIIYGVLTVMGLIPGLDTVFGLVPIFGNDIWLHAVTAIIAAYFGWGPPANEPAPVTAGTTTDHR